MKHKKRAGRIAAADSSANNKGMNEVNSKYVITQRILFPFALVEGIEESHEVVSCDGGEFLLHHLYGDVPWRVEPGATLAHVGEPMLQSVGRVKDTQVTGVAACVAVTRTEVYIDAIEEELEGGIYLLVAKRYAALFERSCQRARVADVHLLHAVAPYLHHLVCPGFDIGAHGL